MTASLRRRPSSPATPPLEDDDLLAEILLRLPPLPSSLPRASAVCKRWRGLASDPRFTRRFRAHHRRNPPLLGCFVENNSNIRFQHALEPPNRVPEANFSLAIDADDISLPLGCRHGLVLTLLSARQQLLVWDPVTGDQHRLDRPPGLDRRTWIAMAVLRPAGDVHHFQVVAVGTGNMQQKQLVASVYSSKTNIWGNLVLTTRAPPMCGYSEMPAVMIGDSLYWLLGGDSREILECDLGSLRLGVIPMPAEVRIPDDMDCGNIWVVKSEGSGLGFLLLSGFDAQLWNRKTDSDGVASWALQKTIALDKLLSVDSEERVSPVILGFAEDNNMVLLWTSIGVYAVDLESLHFKKLFESEWSEGHYPFEGVYTAGKGMDGGHHGAEFLQNKMDMLSGHIYSGGASPSGWY